MSLVAMGAEGAIRGDDKTFLPLSQRPQINIGHPFVRGSPYVQNVMTQALQESDARERNVLINENPHGCQSSMGVTSSSVRQAA